MSSTVQLQEGLTPRTFLAMLFSSLVMMPALLWVYLATGQLVGTLAAAYATMLIFGELGLIMMSPLSASELATIRWGASIAAGYTGGFLFTVYLRKSPITKQFGIAQNIPWWACPPENSPAIIQRMIWHPDWLLPLGIGLLSMTLVLAADVSLSFIARTLFIEVEKLPFPTGAVAAEIAIALSGGEKERYRIFAIATMMAAIYESIRVLFPSLTEIILGRRLMVINPIHYDFTEMIDPVIHGATTGITTNLLVIATGLIVPEIVIIWQFITSIVTYVLLPPIFIGMGARMCFFSMHPEDLGSCFLNYLPLFLYWRCVNPVFRIHYRGLTFFLRISHPFNTSQSPLKRLFFWIMSPIKIIRTITKKTSKRLLNYCISVFLKSSHSNRLMARPSVLSRSRTALSSPSTRSIAPSTSSR